MRHAVGHRLGHVRSRHRLQEVVGGGQKGRDFLDVLLLIYDFQLVDAVNGPRRRLGRACDPVHLNGHGQRAVGFNLHIEALGLYGAEQVRVELHGGFSAGYHEVTRRIRGYGAHYFGGGHVAAVKVVGVAELTPAVAAAQTQEHRRGAGVITLALQ